MSKYFIEAESFDKLGGWVIDTQSVLQMGSAYIMAHGLGKPVEDAKTEIRLEEDGEYSFWIRTRDWTAPWSKSSAGKFSLLVDGDILPETLGTNGNEWAWQLAGTKELQKGKHCLALHDLTGFNGRLDAIYITNEKDVPSNTKEAVKSLRESFSALVIDHEEYDLIVVGGGIAGVCTAISAQRNGCKVLLLHDREVLGGCNSSEVRVCLGGSIHVPPYRNMGNIVKEIGPVMGAPYLYDAKYYEDARKESAFMLFGNVTLRFNEYVFEAEKEGNAIKTVTSLNTKTGTRTVYKGKLYADCSGDAVLARLTGAELMYGTEAKDEFNESLGRDKHENLVMGQSIRWYSEEREQPADFPDIDWGLSITEESCLHVTCGDWEQESGFRRQMAEETEYIRDYGLRAIFSNWAFQKNHSLRKEEYKNTQIKWISYVGGKRESYRVKGDYILTQNDIDDRVDHEDKTAGISWTIDIHYPELDNETTFGEAFRSCAYHRGIGGPYGVPYRCLYSKDISNLFLGGRTVSCSHVAFASLRVMRTLGMLGEVVGMAASICKRYDCLPRAVYTNYLSDLKALLEVGVPSPVAFDHGSWDTAEWYHFKDAGSIWSGKESEYQQNEYYEKVKRNIENIGISHMHKDSDLFRK